MAGGDIRMSMYIMEKTDVIFGHKLEWLCTLENKC